MFKEEEYISVKGFASISKFIFDNKYYINFDSSKIQNNDIVFLNLDNFNYFLKILSHNPPKNKFILITHNSDSKFTYKHYELIKKYVNKIYAVNNTIYDENINVRTIPLGFKDNPTNTIKLLKNIPQDFKKEHFLYLNINTGTNRKKRQYCYDYFSSLDWVYTKSNLTFTEFYIDLKKSKYVISPEGNGIDCHRIYESLYLNSIPILKTSVMDSFYKNLPVIIVSEWNEICKEDLYNDYEKNYEKLVKWKIENPDWIYPSFWLRN